MFSLLEHFVQVVVPHLVFMAAGSIKSLSTLCIARLLVRWENVSML